MESFHIVRWLHLLAAAIWTGGVIVLAFLVVTVRRNGGERALLQSMARTFSRLSWIAMAIAIPTGVWQVVKLGLPWSYGRLHIKMGLVGLAVILALVHQITARKSSPAVRGVFQLAILLVSLAIFAAAVALGR